MLTYKHEEWEEYVEWIVRRAEIVYAILSFTAKAFIGIVLINQVLLEAGPARHWVRKDC